jgi:putative ABC transport system permease protein
MILPTWFRRLPLPTALKHVAGSAWMMSGRLFALGSIAGFGFAVFVGALSAIDSVFEGRDQWYAQGHLADLELRVMTDDVANFPRFDGIPGLADYRVRMVLPGSLAMAGKDALRILLIASATDSAMPINTYTMLEGRALATGDRDGVLIDRTLASYHHIKPGDTLRLKLGKESVSLTVRGVVLDAEFLLAPANPSLFVPSKGSLGVLYANPAVLSERFGFVPANSVLFRAAPGADIEHMRQAVQARAATRLNIDSTASRTEQFSYQFLEKDLGVFRIVVPVIVLVSALSAIFVTVFLFVQWVMHERQILGVFMALGHSRSRLSIAFALMFLYLALGAILGGLLFAVFVGQGFLKNFSQSIGLPLPQLALSPSYLVAGTLGVLLIFALAGAFAIRRVFSLSPRDAMRPAIALGSAPGAIGTLLGRWLPTTWLRIAVRNLIRSGNISLVTIFSVALGFGITSSFFISYSSFIGTSVNRVEQNTWDLAVDFVAPVWRENLGGIVKVAGIGAYTPYTKGVAQAVSHGKRLNLYIGGFDPAKPWHAVAMVAGTGLSEHVPNGILLEQNIARELELGVGDTLALETLGRKREARIQGLFSGAMPGEARLPIEFHRDLADLDNRATGLFVRVRGDTSEVARKLSADPDVQQVLSKKQVSEEILAASGQVTAIIHLGALVSIAIASLFLFACLGYTVLQRKGEYQSLRLLGYGDGLIRAIIVVEILLLGTAALVVAIPIGALAAAYLNEKLSGAWFQVDTIITLNDYLKTFIPSFIVLPLAALPIARMVLREPLHAHLRSREIS